MARCRSPCLRQTRTFLSTLAAEVERSRENLHLDNYDVSQLGPYRGEKHREDLVGPKAERAGDAAPHELATRLSQFADVGFLHGILADQESRDLLIKLFAYRTLGYRKVKLPRNTEQYWDDIQAVRSAATTSPPIPIAYMDMRLARHDMHRFAYDLQIYGTAAGIACTFVQKQYEYHRGGVVCKAEPGDVAIDAGACWGETTVYFAHEVGAAGSRAVVRVHPDATWRCCAATWKRTCRSPGASTSSRIRSGRRRATRSTTSTGAQAAT